MNLIDYLLLLLIAGAVILALRKIHKDRKNGKSCSCGSSSCSGSCAGCSAKCSAKCSACDEQ